MGFEQKLLQGERVLHVANKTFVPLIVSGVLWLIPTLVFIISLIVSLAPAASSYGTAYSAPAFRMSTSMDAQIQNMGNSLISTSSSAFGAVIACLISAPISFMFFVILIISLISILNKYNLVITDKRVLAVRGNATISMPYENITGMQEYKRGFDSLYRCGRIVITCGQQNYGFKYILSSAEAARIIMEYQERFKAAAEMNHAAQVAQAMAANQQGANVYAQPAVPPQIPSQSPVYPPVQNSAPVQGARRFCSKCGTPNDSEDVFCKACGAKLK